MKNKLVSSLDIYVFILSIAVERVSFLHKL